MFPRTRMVELNVTKVSFAWCRYIKVPEQKHRGTLELPPILIKLNCVYTNYRHRLSEALQLQTRTSA